MRGFSKALFVFLLVAGLALPAFPWGSATHAYIANRIGRILPPANTNEIYGLIAPDLFFYDFHYALREDIYVFTHGAPGYEYFLGIWAVAPGGMAKSLAYGFVAHNDVWGADVTAHHPPRNYVINKAMALIPMIDWSGVEALIGPVSDEDKLLLCHNVVEGAGDILIRRADPTIGARLLGAALLRDDSFPGLLASFIPSSVVTLDEIKANERLFRQAMVLYGGALMQPEPVAIKLLAQQYGQMAVEYLAAKFGGAVPQPVADAVMAVSLQGLTKAVGLLAPDFMAEIRLTISQVKVELAAHGVVY